MPKFPITISGCSCFGSRSKSIILQNAAMGSGRVETEDTTPLVQSGRTGRTRGFLVVAAYAMLLAAGAWAALTRLQTAAWSLYVAFCCWYGGLAVENDPPLTLEEAEQLFRDARKDCFF